MAPEHRRAWFDQGCEAFKCSFPSAASEVPWASFYVCPLCLLAFSESALETKELTLEHVPPKSVGGRKLALTCGQCNHGSGTQMDSHMRNEAHFYDFLAGNLAEIKAVVQTPSAEVPIRLSAAGGSIVVAGVQSAVHPAVHRKMVDDLEVATSPEGRNDFEFKLTFPEFSPNRAAASWLRSAYLAFFSTLGYRFICRPEMRVVRQRIQNPELDQPATFRIIRPETSAPTLIRVNNPEPFRSYAMLYGRNVVFLPRFNDHDLYNRLAAHPDTKVTFSATHYPWPAGRPRFLFDSPGDAPR